MLIEYKFLDSRKKTNKHYVYPIARVYFMHAFRPEDLGVDLIFLVSIAMSFLQQNLFLE